jgi:hypothetical protein
MKASLLTGWPLSRLTRPVTHMAYPGGIAGHWRRSRLMPNSLAPNSLASTDKLSMKSELGNATTTSVSDGWATPKPISRRSGRGYFLHSGGNQSRLVNLNEMAALQRDHAKGVRGVASELALHRSPAPLSGLGRKCALAVAQDDDRKITESSGVSELAQPGCEVEPRSAVGESRGRCRSRFARRVH